MLITYKEKTKKTSFNAESLAFDNSKGQEVGTTVKASMQQNSESDRKTLEVSICFILKVTDFVLNCC